MLGKESIVRLPVDAVCYEKDSLLELVGSGYGFRGEREVLVAQVQREYANADLVYFAVQDGAEEASLSVGLRPSMEYDPFWKTLGLLGRSFHQDDVACYIYGIVTHPKLRRGGIANSLMGKMIEDLEPIVVFGQTNRPEAVSLRTNVLKKQGYRTFFGFCEVTPDSDYTREYEGTPFVEASFAAEGARSDPFGVYFASTETLPAYLSETDGLSPEIQKAFKPIQEAQQAAEEGQEACSTLVSIKRSAIS